MNPGSAKSSDRRPVLLYDGECGLCNAVVRFLLRQDTAARLHFAPLQSAPGQEYLRAQGLPPADFDSLVFVRDWNQQAHGAFLLRTDGALAACAEVGGLGGALAGFRVLPVWFRDACYRLVARWRYRLFGVYRPTPLPNPAWEKQFLSR